MAFLTVYGEKCRPVLCLATKLGMCCNHGRQYYRHDRTMIWFFSTEDLKNEIPPARGVVFCLRKTCHAGENGGSALPVDHVKHG